MCFEHLFLRAKGNAKLIDEHHSPQRSPYYISAKREKIVFHKPEHADPDNLVKTCFLMMTTSASEAQCGIESLWQRGQSNGRLDYANIGRRVDRNYFK